METVGIFIAVVVVLLVMVGFFFLAFRSVIATVGRFAQNNVLRQAGVLDELIFKKEEALQNLQLNITRQQARLDELALAMPQAPATTVLAPDYQVLAQGAYKDAEFIEEYREIRDNFVFDSGKLVRSVVNQLPGKDELTPEQRKAAIAQEILDGLDIEATYNLMTLSGDDQLALFREVLQGEKLQLLEEYAARGGYFETYDFLGWLRQYVFENASTISIRTSHRGEDFDALDARVTTSYDDTLCEGISIVSGGKLYDFSIQNREIVG
ncbi:MAG: hypothetical protein LBH64_01385 [Coriobacteriales bacterium]|nr:hypothetical protein [Coriobacteriales bacterium]